MATSSLFLVQEIWGIHLEELAFMCGLRALLSQVLRVKSPVLEVLLNNRSSCFLKEVFWSPGYICAHRTAVVHMGLEPEACSAGTTRCRTKKSPFKEMYFQ